MIGELLGQYRIASKIGQGGRGVVYRAYDEVLERDVALNVVREDTWVEESSRQNPLREARAASALSHRGEFILCARCGGPAYPPCRSGS